MNESSRQETTPALSCSTRDAVMSLAEKAAYWVMLLVKVFYSFVGLLLGLLLIVALEYLLIDRLWPHQRLGPPIAIMSLVLPVLYLCLFIMFLMHFIRRIYRRKIKTGYILPTGEELNVIRIRRKMPEPLWKRIAIAAFFCWIAIGSTFSLLNTQHHRVSWWVIPVLMWMIAITVTATAFLASEPKWALPVIATLYCLAAIYCTIGVLASQHPWGNGWFFTSFMWMSTAVFIVAVFRHSTLWNAPPLSSKVTQTLREAENL